MSWDERILQQRKLSISKDLFGAKTYHDEPKSTANCDRYIPRRADNRWDTTYATLPDLMKTQQTGKKTRESGENARDSSVYNIVLRNELLGERTEDVKSQCDERQVLTPSKNRNLFRFGTPTKGGEENLKLHIKMDTFSETVWKAISLSAKIPKLNFYNIDIKLSNTKHYSLICVIGSGRGSTDRTPSVKLQANPYSLSPLSMSSQRLLRSPHKATRKISRIPFKVLDAPELQDDFYLNLVDWSVTNVLSVGLGSCVYLWSACTSQVTRLCDLSADGNVVTSVAWSERGHLVAVGTHHGYVTVWDVAVNKQVNKLQGHSARVGALAWNGDVLSSGSRDRLILQRDTRTPPTVTERRLVGHRQEVCGLKWSPDNQYLASGGNDNRLYVWNMQSLSPVQTYTDHLAAVKAIAWSPHHHGLLASGGGTADRCIRFWNTLTGQPMQSVDTGSQVCNLAWSKHSSELVSTHGYSQNQILVWKYPSLTQVAKLTGHSYRVLYLALSPDGEAIVTGAGDETLRFWNVFSKARSQKETRSVLSLYTGIR